MEDIPDLKNNLWKRQEQLDKWKTCETNKASSELRDREKSLIHFSDSFVFLAACSAFDEEEILLLLKKGADINTANVDGLTALHQACIDDDLRRVQFLIDRGASLNVQDNEGWTPLHAASSCGFVDVARCLIQQGANIAMVNNDGELPIDLAESNVMTQLLNTEMDKQGVDVEAARSEEECLMLHDAKQWLNTKSFDDRPHPKTGATALHVAAAKGYIDVMKVLLQAGADVDAKDVDGWTPLHAAAHWAEEEACQLLADNMCNMVAKNNLGQTPADVADEDLVTQLEDLRKQQATKRQELEEKRQQEAAKNAITGRVRRNSNTRQNVDERSPTSEVINTNLTLPPSAAASQVKVVSSSGTSSAVATVTPVSGSTSLPASRSSEVSSSSAPKVISTASMSAVTSVTTSSAPSSSVTQANRLPPVTVSTSSAGLPTQVTSTLSSTSIVSSTSVLKTSKPELVVTSKAQQTPSVAVNAISTTATSVSNSQRQLNAQVGGASNGTHVLPTVRKVGDVTTSSGSTASTSSAAATVTVTATGTLMTSAVAADSTADNSANRKSFEIPKRDSEKEVERKAKARKAREERRSTQGVSKEDLEEASQRFSPGDTTVPEPTITVPGPTITVPGPSISIPGPTTTIKGPSSIVPRSTTAVSGLTTVQPGPTTTTISGSTTTVVRPSTTAIVPTTAGSRPAIAVTGSTGAVSRSASSAPVLTSATASSAPTLASTSRNIGSVEGSQRATVQTADVVDGNKSRSQVQPSADGRVAAVVRPEQVKPKTTTSPTTVSNSGTSPSSVTIDYRKLYEEERQKNACRVRDMEKLKKELGDTRTDIERAQAASRHGNAVPADNQERRTLERRISALEEEVKAMEMLKAENQRLKHENGALIRVISKLSK